MPYVRSFKFDDLVSKWSSQDALLQNDFDVIEPVFSTRCALLDVLGHVSGGAASTRRQLMTQLERFAACACDGGRHQVAECLLHRLRQLEVDVGITCWSWRVQEARMFWSRGEHDNAKHLLRHVCSDLQQVRYIWP